MPHLQVLSYTRKGRNFIAVGDNAMGAQLVGISVVQTKIWAFVLSGLFASLAGMIFASRIGFITPMAGNAYEMKAIAACVLGGISLSGGLGTVIGAAIGAVIMTSMTRILVFLGFSSNYDNTITGIILIGISLSGGLGTVIGAAIGAVIMTSMTRILVFLGFSSNYDNTITGIILIAIVVVNTVLQNRAIVKNRHEISLKRIAQSVGGGN